MAASVARRRRHERRQWWRELMGRARDLPWGSAPATWSQSRPAGGPDEEGDDNDSCRPGSGFSEMSFLIL